MSNTIKAVIFDFGQTLVDSANGFRQAEKDAQEKLFGHMALSLKEKFLDRYRHVRKEFHGRSDFSRPAMWREIYHYHCLVPDEALLRTWETEYWNTVKARTILFPETTSVLKALNTRFSVALITNTQGQPASTAHRLSAFRRARLRGQELLVLRARRDRRGEAERHRCRGVSHGHASCSRSAR
jgi:FMN phosphatase YigB (HAD superfamily)